MNNIYIINILKIRIKKIINKIIYILNNILKIIISIFYLIFKHTKEFRNQ